MRNAELRERGEVTQRQALIQIVFNELDDPRRRFRRQCAALACASPL
jgi:hypothetical protein